MAIRVELELIDGTFTTRMLHAGESINQFNRALARAHPQAAAMTRNGDLLFRSFQRADEGAQGFLGTLRDFSVVAGALTLAIAQLQQVTVQYVGAIVQVNAEFERMTRLLAGMSTAADPMADAKEQMSQFREMASRIPLAMETIMGGAVKLKAVGIDPLGGSLQSVADAVTAFGGGDEAFNRAILAMTQMSGKGVIQMEELRQQLGEAIPRATELMARSMGVSYAQLMDLIATGTVESSHALQSMQLEFERTFGGAAIRQMSTYTGQVELLKTNLQNLALNIGGDFSDSNSFFGELKNQLRDLNFFLEGPQAQEFAKKIGDGLRTALVYFRQAIDLVIQFKDELASLATIMAIAFGGQLLIRGIGSIMGMFEGFRTRLRDIRMEWVLFGQAMRGGMASFSAIPAGAGIAANALGGVGMAASVAGRGIAALSMTLGAISGIIPVIGLAIWGLAEYFDWFGKSTAEALAELDRLEQKSNQLETKKKLQPAIDALQAELEDYKAQAEVEIERQGRASPSTLEDIKEIEKEIISLQARINSAVQKASEEDVRRAASDARTRLADRTAELNTIFDLRKKKIMDEADTEMAAGKSVVEVDKRRKEQLLAANNEYYAERMKILTEYITTEQALIGVSRDPAQIEIARARLGVYVGELNQIREAQQQFAETGMFVKTVDGGDDIAKKAQSATTALANLKEEAAGLRNQINGGTTAMGQLIAKIRNGDFGDLNDDGVRKFTEELIRAQQEVDNLKEALDYITGAQKLYDDTMGGIGDRIFDLKTEGMNDAEKYVVAQQRLASSLSPGGRIGLMMMNLKGSIDQTNTSLGGLVTGFVDGLFGTETTSRGQTVVGILDQMLQRVLGITGAIGGLQFSASGSSMGMSFTGPRMSGPTIEQAVKNGILSLIGAAEGTDKGRGYNETLAYGALTGGPVDLVNMTLREVRALQEQMLANPANKWNSSAVGRYQIVGKTLEGLIKKLDLSLDQKFTPELQDRLARELVKGRQGQGPDGLRAEWEGLRRVDNASINAALANGDTGATGAPNVVRNDMGQIITLKQQFQNIINGLKEEGALVINSEKTKYLKQLEDITEKAKGASDAEVELRRRIREGGLNQLDKDPDSPRYKELFDIIKKVDEAEKGYQDTKSKRKDVDEALKRNTEDLAEAERLLKTEQTKDTNPYAEQQAGLEALKQKYDELIAKAKEVYGVDSTQYKTLLSQKEQALKLQQQRDFTSTMQILGEKRQAEEEANLTEIQRSNRTIDQKIADLREYLANFKGTEAEKLAVAQQVNATIAALEQQRGAVSTNAFTQQMQQWSDLGNNMAQYMSGVASSMADALTSMIMGEEVDWQALLKNMIKDLVNMGIKYLMSSLMGGKGQVAGMMSGKGGKGGMGGKGMMAKGGGKGAFGIAHTGGIVGRLSGSKMVSPLAFAGAPRFHEGGLIRGMGLGPDEVPIIAKKGEGVFTPEQMSAMAGGSRSMAVNTNVTVNAQGGDKTQNEDLARQVAREVESSVRGIVYKEMRAQMRPGNMMNRS